jgi:hypothetical protein
MSSGTIKLFPIANVHLAALAVAPGPVAWVTTQAPDGIGAYNLSDHTFHSVHTTLSPTNGVLVANGSVWMVVSGGSPGEILRRPLSLPPSGSFTQVGQPYPLTRSVTALMRSTDGSIWAALGSNVAGTMSRLERLPVRPLGRLQTKQPLSVSIDLPDGWFPTSLAPAPPDSAYVVARLSSTKSVLGRVKLQHGAHAQTLAALPAGFSRAPHPGANGSVWVAGAGPGAGDDGWLARFDFHETFTTIPDAHGVAVHSYGKLTHWNYPDHDCTAVAEGVDGRMFLLRTRGLLGGGDWQSEILMFKLSPIGGAGPTTKINAPVLASQLVPDSQGGFWFTTLRKTADPKVRDYGLGRFVPPDVDPLNP